MFVWFRRLQEYFAENSRRAWRRYICERELPRVENILNNIATSKPRGKEMIPVELVRNVCGAWDEGEKRRIEEELIRGRNCIDVAEFNQYFAQLLCEKYNAVLEEDIKSD